MQHAMESFKGNTIWKEISAMCQEKLLPLQRLSELVLGIINKVMDGEKFYLIAAFFASAVTGQYSSLNCLSCSMQSEHSS